MKQFILMLQFFTKFYLPFKIEIDDEKFYSGVIYLPIIGLLIGLFLCLIFYVSNLVFSKFISIVLVVISEIFITGGLHLDGLADSFDGLYSYRDKDRMLEIMKDSRIGTNGVLAIVCLILLKVAFLYSVEHMMFLLILMPTVSRLMLVFISRISRYARDNGMGGFFIGRVKNNQLIIALMITLIINVIYIKSMIIIPFIMLFTYIYRQHVYSKIDGITGDILGALIEMSEVIYIMAFLILEKL